MMQTYFASGQAIDVVLAFMVVEALFLVIMRKRPTLTVALTILPGAAMMLALRAALTGGSWQMIGLWLTVSLPLHLADLRHRRLI
jgi:hypothetical protein